MNALQITWFWLVIVLLVGYTILDGFDLGAGVWHLFSRKDEERRTYLRAIGPFWDGNEVWLITGVGATFAAFPAVYASVFSGLYLPLMVVIFALIFRAVSIEFGSKERSPRTRARWGVSFGVSSVAIIVLLGIAFGDILCGLPLNAQGDFVGNPTSLLSPFALLVGVLNLAMLATHGALYLQLRTDGAVAERLRVRTSYTWVLYLVLAIVTLLVAAGAQGHLRARYTALPWLWAVPTLAIVAILLTGFWQVKGKTRRAFIASSSSIALLFVSAAAALFPTMVPALGHPAWNLTITNASSSPLTLKTMLILTIIGLPIVLGYTHWVYRTFGGKVDDSGYY